jgi:hypothetical protein
MFNVRFISIRKNVRKERRFVNGKREKDFVFGRIAGCNPEPTYCERGISGAEPM